MSTAWLVRPSIAPTVPKDIGERAVTEAIAAVVAANNLALLAHALGQHDEAQKLAAFGHGVLELGLELARDAGVA